MTLAKRWSRQDDFDASVEQASASYNVPVALIKAVIGVESGFNPSAINKNDPGYAWGLMQMIPTTARALGFVGDMGALLTNTGLAINLGAMLLRQNLSRTGGAVADSVSAYNGGFRPSLGLGAVRADGTYANQAYVDRVLDTLAYFNAYAASKVPATMGPLPPPLEVGTGLEPLPFRPGSGSNSPGRRPTWALPLAGIVGGGLLWLLIYLGLLR